MPFAKNYSFIYDYLYKKKDYKFEANLALKVIKNYRKSINDILEIGCGSGNFTKILIKKDYSVTAIDPSKEMIKIAKKKIKSKNLNFLNARSTNFKIKERKFDVCISLFHVFSYHTKNKEINLFFKNISEHLKKDGVMIFDFWFKPAVLWLKPEKRIRIIENKNYKIIRKISPTWIKSRDLVFSNYEINILNKKTKKIKKFSEKHPMRYFSINQVKKIMNKYNLKFLRSLDILKNKPPKKNSWGATIVAKKLN